jgi:hypothetical protein
MRRMRYWQMILRSLAWTIVLTVVSYGVVSGPLIQGQDLKGQTVQAPSARGRRAGSVVDRTSAQEEEMRRKQERELRKKDYEETKKMSEDLVKAASELKEMVEKAGENTLPVQAVRKAEEIEGLSKKIKSRLKGGG